MVKEVIKRNGKSQKFSELKIRRAIMNANDEVPEKEKATLDEINKIVRKIKSLKDSSINIELIQDMIEDSLMDLKRFELARKYIIYRYIHNVGRDLTNAEVSVLSLINGTNKEVINENSNKNAFTNSTQRDLIAGEISKEIADKLLLPDDIKEAINKCWIHWHDKDYTIQNMFNCFSRDTEFITINGVKSFEDFNNGDEVDVFTHTGAVKHARVRCYGKQLLYNVIFKRGSKSYKSIKVTRNHRWLLNNGNETMNLNIGDSILVPPVIDSFNMSSCSQNLCKYWCLGFAIGDGHDYDNSKYQQTGWGISVRLCDKKVKYADMFTKAGFNVTEPESLSGDYHVYMVNYSKSNFLNNKLWRTLSTDEKIALFNGYICADGEFRQKPYPTGISTINKHIEEMVYDLAEMSGYYLGKSRVVTGATNFVDERTPMSHIQFSRQFYEKQPFKCISIQPLYEDDVWCLEVEDDKSFILSGGLVTGNCCLIDIQGMLDYGTVINGLAIESPHSFRVACNIMTQIIANVASNQYGGQSVAIKHLGKYLRRSKQRYERIIDKYLRGTVLSYEDFLDSTDSSDDEVQKAKEQFNLFKSLQKEIEILKNCSDEQIQAIKKIYESILLRQELRDGVQTIQYQINTLMTSNG